jgi:hypothetical protein
MKNLQAFILLLAVIVTGCRKIEVDGPAAINPGGAEQTTLIGRITENRTLKSGNTYTLDGLVYVTNGAVLTIEPGTKIVGGTNQKGGLVITKNAKLMAAGTAENPIVFTSGSATPQRGDWAGVVILGNAPVNATFNGQQGVGEVEGGINNSEGFGLYGGTNPADNSGILKYVRIEYAGYAFLPDKEINGLTLAGVGNQTIVDYVQVSYANDDAFEWFGGTVNSKHLISYKALDDDFDTDNGFSGKVQFGIVLRDSAVADISKSEAFESDNDANGSTLAPQTSAVFSNMTIVGPKADLNNTGNSLFLAAVQIRRNSSLSLFNSVIMGWPQGLLIDASKGTPTDVNITNNTLLVQNTIIAGSPVAVKYAPSSTSATGATDASINSWFNTAAFGNQVLTRNSEVGLVAPFNYSAPDFNPSSSSVAATGAAFSHSKLNVEFFTPTNYKGACAVGDTWWKGWTRF